MIARLHALRNAPALGRCIAFATVMAILAAGVVLILIPAGVHGYGVYYKDVGRQLHASQMSPP